MARSIAERFKAMWRQSTWTWQPRSEREAGDAVVRNLLLHWFPSKVHRMSIAWSTSMYLGVISAYLFLILILTGLGLMFLYVPSVERAYASVKDIEFAVSFGTVLRGQHRMAAHLMVAVVFVHMARVFFTGAYRSATAANGNRELNWIVGVFMLLTTLFLSFTGYLLPWDQLAYWAITVGTNIARAAPLLGEQMRYLLLGGNTIDQNALLRFYVLHCIFLPAALLLMFSYHMWRIRKDGGMAVVDRLAVLEQAAPVKTKSYTLMGIAKGTTVQVETSVVDEEKDCLSSSPHLLRRLVAVFAATLAVVTALAIFVPAPLETPADPGLTPNPAKAPWYFLWLQELVADTTFKVGGFTVDGALVGGIVLPGLLVALLLVWPYLDRSPKEAVGCWFHSTRSVQNIVFAVSVILLLVFLIIGTFMRGPYWNFYWPWESWPGIPAKI
ncbi:MAG: cytochrome b N-terminal domain-containing protein [Acidobacteriota bacterium]